MIQNLRCSKAIAHIDSRWAYRLFFLTITFFVFISGNAQNPLLLSNPVAGSTGRAIQQVVTTPNGNTFFNTVDGDPVMNYGDTWGLWVTDGTPAGSKKLTLQSGIFTSQEATQLTPFGNNKILFAGDNAQTYGELWVSDGTQVGTFGIQHFNSGGSYHNAPVQGIAVIGNKGIYAAVSGDDHLRLYATTAASYADTSVLYDFGRVTVSSIALLKNINDIVYFDFYDVDNGGHDIIWRTDGTASGTYLVKDLGEDGLLSYFMQAGSVFYFGTTNGNDGLLLWKSDGSAAGTSVVKQISATTDNNVYPSFAAIANTLYFKANDGVNGAELWQTDGTDAGTKMVADINSGAGNATPNYLIVLNNVLYFSANDGINGAELWKYDPAGGTGPQLVKDIFPGATGSNPASLTVQGNTILFAAAGNSAVPHLWLTDGSRANTIEISELVTYPSNFSVFENIVFFSAEVDVNGDGVPDPCLYKYTAPQNTQRPYITVWKTDNPGAGTTNQISFQTKGAFYYTWELENNPSVNGSGLISGSESDYVDATLNFPSAGTYRVYLSPTGSFAHYFPTGGDGQKLLKVEQWGDVAWSSMDSAYAWCSNLTVTATDVPNLSNVTDMRGMFWRCSSITNVPNLNSWDVTKVTDMSYMFLGDASFNQDIGKWDVSNVTNMRGMFTSATSFNQDIGKWDVSNVTNMAFMFSSVTSFNQDIGGWDVSNVTDMHGLFGAATSFNQDISKWDVSNVTDMNNMFAQASSFNQNIEKWDVSKVTDMSYLFGNATSFNQNIGGWDVGKVTDMSGMFGNATSFNQDIGNWNISSLTNGTYMFYGSGIDCSNYNKILAGWAANPNTANNVVFSMQEKTYGPAGRAARDVLISHGWTMDGNAYYNEACGQSPYITVWKTDNPGANATNQISFQTKGSFNYTWEQADNPAVNGNGSISGSESVYQKVTLNFPSAGTYRLYISPTGTFAQTNANTYPPTMDPQKLLRVEQWGDVVWSSMSSTFRDCSNLTITANDVPNLSHVTDMTAMFDGCTSITNIPNISSWDVSHVTNIATMFEAVASFNQDISNWDVSNVTNMAGLFNGAASFNQDIGNWNVGKVTNMRLVFGGTTSFNQDISKWDVSHVTNMQLLFSEASSFNQDISKWDVSSVTTMLGMFSGAASFNQDISKWNVSHVTDMSYMFGINKNDIIPSGATSFNQDISKWDVSKITDMHGMFNGATAFNQDIGNWNISSLTKGDSMFNKSGTDCNTYNKILVGWSTNPHTANNVSFSNQGKTYGPAGRAGRDTLISHGWTMDDDSYYDEGCVILPVPVIEAWGDNPVGGSFGNKMWVENPQPAEYVERHYEITPDNNPATSTGRITLYFTNLDFKDFNSQIPAPELLLPDADDPATIEARKANLLIEKHGGTSNDGTGLPDSYPGTAITINPADEDIVWNDLEGYWQVSFNVTGFSGFFVKTTTNALPVTIVSFTATAQSDKVLLQWSTATEINSKDFTVERSFDGAHFESVGTIAASGNSNVRRDYTFNDWQINEMMGRVVFYRVKETDQDGKTFYTDVRKVAVPLKNNQFTLLYNPVRNEALFNYSSSVRKQVSVRVIDHLGRVIINMQQRVEAGDNQIRIQTNALASGVYEVEFRSNGEQHIVRMMK